MPFLMPERVLIVTENGVRVYQPQWRPVEIKWRNLSALS
jgi:hypothetical protein